LYGNNFNIGNNIFFGAIIKHFLGFGGPANH
jgi:hypothetical protein